MMAWQHSNTMSLTLNQGTCHVHTWLMGNVSQVAGIWTNSLIHNFLNFHPQAPRRASSTSCGLWRTLTSLAAPGGEAPSSSTTERVFTDTLMDIEQIPENKFEEAPRLLFHISQRDLHQSCQAYAEQPTKDYCSLTFNF